MDVKWVAARLAGIPGMVGGSRARGEERPDSDWDCGLYSRGTSVRMISVPWVSRLVSSRPARGDVWSTAVLG